MDNVREIIRRAKDAKGRQGQWYTYWDDLARVHIPRMLGFMEQRPEAERQDDIFDGTPMHAARGLANAIGGLLRPDGEDWVRIKAEDDALNSNDEAKRWLDFASVRLRAAMENPKARMRQATGEVDLMLVVFGTGPLFIGENKTRDRLLYQAVPLRDAAIDWGEDGPMSLYRFKSLNVRQAIAEFGEENLGRRAKDLVSSKDWQSKLTYIHAVTPRDHQPGKTKKNMPFASLWIEEESAHLVAESGYFEFPYIVPRMETAPGEDYGRSPAMVALPDANTLQAMGETILIAGQRAADPPIFAPNDGTFVEANTFPGGISYYDADLASKLRGNPIFPMDTGHNLPISRDMQRDSREQVFAAFFRNVLNLPIAGPQMTATEVIQRREEMIREVGPLFGRLESDYTAPMVERTFNIMLRGGAFFPIPKVLAGKDIVFEYESPVKRARQMIEIETARQFKMEMIELSQFDPKAFDNFNTDEYVRHISTTLRVPAKLLNPPEWVAAKRENDKKMQAAQMELVQAQQLAGIAKDAGPAMKNLEGIM